MTTEWHWNDKSRLEWLYNDAGPELRLLRLRLDCDSRAQAGALTRGSSRCPATPKTSSSGSSQSSRNRYLRILQSGRLRLDYGFYAIQKQFRRIASIAPKLQPPENDVTDCIWIVDYALQSTKRAVIGHRNPLAIRTLSFCNHNRCV